MSYKKGTIIADIVIALLAGAFIVMAKAFPAPLVKLQIMPSYYPTGVASLLIIFCVISLIKTFRTQDDRVVPVGNWGRIISVIIICILFAVLWKLTGLFYPVCFVATAALMFILNPQKKSLKKVGKALLYSLITQAVVYLVFTRLMHFRL